MLQTTVQMRDFNSKSYHAARMMLVKHGPLLSLQATDIESVQLLRLIQTELLPQCYKLMCLRAVTRGFLAGKKFGWHRDRFQAPQEALVRDNQAHRVQV